MYNDHTKEEKLVWNVILTSTSSQMIHSTPDTNFLEGCLVLQLLVPSNLTYQSINTATK